MKIRNGFVTNSSSSSYIIAFKNLDKVINLETQEILDLNENTFPYFKIAWKMYKNLMSKVFKSTGETRIDIFKNEDDINNHFNNYYGYNDLEEAFEDGLKDIYDCYTNYLNKGFTVVKFEIDNNEEWLINFLSDIADGEEIISIR